MWYSSHKLLSHNKTLNFIVGNRGGGKTIECQRLVVSSYIKGNNECVWIRRHDVELDNMFMEKFFTDHALLSQFPNHDFKAKKSKYGGVGYIKSKNTDTFLPFIHFMSLSTALKHKSIPFTRVKYIIFDEFIIDKKSNMRYLKNEVFVFLELLQSIMRLREDVRVIFVGNSISIINPYFIYYNIKRLEKEFTIKGEICVQYYKNKEYTQKMKESRFGKLVENTEYAKYSIDNEFFRDNSIFIEKRPPTSKYWYAIKCDDKICSIWQDGESGNYYVCNSYDKNKPLFCFTNDDHTINTTLVNSVSSNFAIQCLINKYDRGKIRFDNIHVKATFLDVLYYLGK